MKKITYMTFLGFCIAILATCAGQPGYDSPSEFSNSLISGNYHEIELLRIGSTQQNEIIGLSKWTRLREGKFRPSTKVRSLPFLTSAGYTITTKGKQHEPENKGGSVFGRGRS